MRLLHRSDDGIVSLTEDLADDHSIPPYAILSHTWGSDDDEVTFEDMANGEGEDKSGYEKIRFCGEQAGRDGLQYFWIDTCCINKTDKAELSRSINSMYLWYRNAAQCYAYLSDVSTLKRKRDENSKDTRELSFQRSRWFTRGWTLQELLAPASVKFFSSDRTQLGDKNSLGQQIHTATNIPLSALQGDHLSQFSISERMKWIEHRETKREEDRAYSLLGIFGVHISPRYGEGEASAFKRLHDEIEKLEKCILDLCLTDPREDKRRIEDTKGGLLEGSYRWILENPDFQQWRNNQQSRLLWIKGDPGKGKTMLLCGSVDELKKSMAKSDLLSYFFCQATDSRINNATAVLRGLIYLLVYQQPSLISHVRKKYDHAGSKLFEDANAWTALSEVFVSILEDSSFMTAYFVLDALDECTEGLANLLDLVARTSSMAQVRWLVSSRNWPQIEERLELAGSKTKLCLELNADSVSAAVDAFIHHKVHQLAQEKKYDDKTEDAVLKHLCSNAHGTFLWVALVCQDLKTIPRATVRVRLTSFPPGLDSFYERMMTQISNGDESELCKRILATIATVYKPICLVELTSLIETLEDTADDVESLQEIIGLCGSFLTVRNDTIYFIHQSAKDYLLANAAGEIFPTGQGEANREIFSRSLQILSRTLRRDIYNLRAPGYPIEQVALPDTDPLAASRYSCIYWVDHLCNWSSDTCQDHDFDFRAVETFVRTTYLYWLEALSLCRSMSEGVVAMAKLEALLQSKTEAFKLLELVQDARRFILSHKVAIETSPLQASSSALLFTPTGSLVKRLFRHEEPEAITVFPAMPANWSSCLQTMESHSWSVMDVAFSPDSTRLASALSDSTVRIWNVVSGTCIQTLKGHSDTVWSVVFSPDSFQLASGSSDCTIVVWSARSGDRIQTLMGHSRRVSSIIFSHNSMQLASASDDNTVKIWDPSSGACLRTLTGHSNSVNSVVFSSNSSWLASASGDATVKIWDTSSGACLQTLKDYDIHIYSVIFLYGPTRLASASSDNAIKIWDVSSGACIQALEGHSDYVFSVIFSPRSNQLISASGDSTLRIWDASSGACLQTLEGHGSSVWSVALSPDSNRLASASADGTIKVWDPKNSASLQMQDSHSLSVDSIVFSPDSTRIASASKDSTVRVWDANSGVCLQKLEGHSYAVTLVVFSPNSARLASASEDGIVIIWNTSSGVCLHTLEGHWKPVWSVAFSPNSTRLASASDDGVINIWDVSNGGCLQTMDAFQDSGCSVVFSSDSTRLASAWGDTAKIWDASSGACLQTLEGHVDLVKLVVFSPDSTFLASTSDDQTVKIWNTSDGVCLQTLDNRKTYVNSVAFSPDSSRLASTWFDNTVKIWDISNGRFVQTLEVDGGLNDISFDATGLYLHTAVGTIALDAPIQCAMSTEMKSRITRYVGPGRGSSDRAWITFNSRYVLWLPPDYRPSCSAVFANTIALGVGSGKVWMCSFKHK